jgi:hypothetical protein
MLKPPYPELDDLLEMIGEGLSSDEIRAICSTFIVQQDIF